MNPVIKDKMYGWTIECVHKRADGQNSGKSNKRDSYPMSLSLEIWPEQTHDQKSDQREKRNQNNWQHQDSLKRTILEFENIEFVNVNGFPEPEKRNDDSETDRYFRRCYRDNKENKYLRVNHMLIFAESNEIDVHGIQHDFDAQKNNNNISANQDSDKSY
jgi:hypothetical protein